SGRSLPGPHRRASAAAASPPRRVAASSEIAMKTLFATLFRRRTRPLDRACRPELEKLEDRLVPAGNLLISTRVNSGLSYLVEFPPAGQYVSDTVIPSVGPSEGARDLVVDDRGNVQVFNGVNDPFLSTYAPTGGWAHRTLAGWSTQPTAG